MRADKICEEKNGRFGEFGGAYVPELLITPIDELTKAWEQVKHDKLFRQGLLTLLKNYAGRETPLTEVSRFSEAIFGPRIFLKREDLLHTGAHKLNNALGQCLLAKKWGNTVSLLKPAPDNTVWPQPPPAPIWD